MHELLLAALFLELMSSVLCGVGYCCVPHPAVTPVTSMLCVVRGSNKAQNGGIKNVVKLLRMLLASCHLTRPSSSES